MKPIVFLIVIFSLGACENKPLFHQKAREILTFPKTVSLKGEEKQIDILGVADIMIADTFLIAYTPMRHDYYYWVFNTSNLEKIGGFLPEGRGPDEFYAIAHDKCHDNKNGISKTWLSNGETQYRWNISESVKQGHTVIDSTISRTGILSHGIWYVNPYDNRLTGFQYASDNINCISYDPNTQKETHRHKVFSRNLSPKALEVAAMNTCLKTDHSKIALVGWNNNYICILDADFSASKPLTIYGKGTSINKTLATNPPERILYYSCENGTNRYLYSLYINQPEKNRQYHTGNEEIHIFDWEADPILNIVIPENILFFAVDERNKCLYGLTSDERIYKYDLSEHLQEL